MLNIISISLFSNRISGPRKVVENLIKGLGEIGYPYVINKRLDSCKRLWIHDDMTALEHLYKLDPQIKVVIGPNLFIPARDFPHFPKHLNLNRAVYLHPSDWVKQRCLDFGFKQCPLDVWPTGIDSDEFKPSQNSSRDYVLIYFKQRFAHELNALIEALNQKKIPFKIIKYRHYKQKEYLKLLRNCRYLVWLGRIEAQGIALQEALACNVPMLVFDVSYVGHWVPTEDEKTLSTKEMEKYVKKVTVAPYFDSSCGIKIKKAIQLGGAIDYMENNWKTFRPREYIMENLSLEKQAKDFLNIYEKYWGLSYREGLNEKLMKRGNYRNNFLIRLHFVILNFIKSKKRVFKLYKIIKLAIKR